MVKADDKWGPEITVWVVDHTGCILSQPFHDRPFHSTNCMPNREYLITVRVQRVSQRVRQTESHCQNKLGLVQSRPRQHNYRFGCTSVHVHVRDSF